MKVVAYRNTNFGNSEMVWNVPHPDYDFEGNHTYKTFDNYQTRFPLITNMITVEGTLDFNTTFYDYMIITDDDGKRIFYFINAIVAEKNVLVFSVTLDVITTYDMLSKAITGIIVRKHDTNPNEHRFDYPTALNFEGNYQNKYYSYAGYNEAYGNVRLLESAIDLTKVEPSATILSPDGTGITIAKLPKPSHSTTYKINTWGGNSIVDESKALTMYRADAISEDVLNTLRGIAAEGAISDSYVLPADALEGWSIDDSAILELTSSFKYFNTNMKLSSLEGVVGWVPNNLAIRGMVSIEIMSIQEKTKITFPGWDVKESVDAEGNFRVNLWCDPKPSGSPFCCPDQVLSIHPNEENGVISLPTLEIKSVRGGQWLKNPLVYSGGRGEFFSTVETQLQREQAAYENKVSNNDLTMNQKQRAIEIAQAEYEFESAQVGSAISGASALLSGDIGGIIGAGKSYYDREKGQEYIKQMQALKGYEQEMQKSLIDMAYSNNLKNLNIQESIRRIVPSEVVFEPNDSLGGYTRYNGFLISLVIPDEQSLRAKDMEYSKYGYPVYEPVSHFIILDHLRVNHTVYQFEQPMIEIGGVVGDMIRGVLEGGIRVLSNKYTANNIINNPKVV